MQIRILYFLPFAAILLFDELRTYFDIAGCIMDTVII